MTSITMNTETNVGVVKLPKVVSDTTPGRQATSSWLPGLNTRLARERQAPRNASVASKASLKPLGANRTGWALDRATGHPVTLVGLTDLLPRNVLGSSLTALTMDCSSPCMMR